jgi:4-oxalocrotonate tautomerase
MPVVTIRMAKGRSLEQKKRIVTEFTQTLVSTLGVDPSWITIFIEELDKENICKSGFLLSETR